MSVECYNIDFAAHIGLRIGVERPKRRPDATAERNVLNICDNQRANVDGVIGDEHDGIPTECALRAGVRVVRRVVRAQNDVACTVYKCEWITATHRCGAVDIATRV